MKKVKEYKGQRIQQGNKG